MRVHILGSAAGGGFPQWNCNCVNCAGLRSGALRAKARTQCSVAVSADGSRWSILNASPDLRAQIFSFPELLPKGRVRGSAIDAVLLSDAELDHITGLLSLREAQPIRLYCTPQVFEWVFASNPIFAALNQPDRFRVTRLEDRKVETVGCGLGFEAIFVSGKVPTYVKTPAASCDGAAVAYRLIDNDAGSSLLYVPAIKEIDERFIAAAADCDCLLFDGSFWSDDEMERRGYGDADRIRDGSHRYLGTRRQSRAARAIFESEKSILTSTTLIRFSMRPRSSAAKSKKRDGKSPKTEWILRCDFRREQYGGK